MARPDIPSARWVGLPASWTKGRKSGQPSVIFIHTTEGGEGRTSAEDGAAYDKSRDDGTSTHLFVDPDSTTQEVEFRDEAHAARSHGNDVGIQIEVCGRAGQTTAQWHDANSTAILDRLIRACFEIRALYGKARFPLVNLTPAQLRAGEHGFAEHYDATRAWPEDGGTHSDPGPYFPWNELFAGIRELETPKGWDEMATKAEVTEAAQDGSVAAFTTAIPWTGRSGERIRALGWGNLSIAGRLDYLMELIATAEKAPGVSGAVMARIDRIETEVDSLAETLARIEAALAGLVTPPAAK